MHKPIQIKSISELTEHISKDHFIYGLGGEQLYTFNTEQYPTKEDYIKALRLTFFPAKLPYIKYTEQAVKKQENYIFSKIALNEFEIKYLTLLFNLLEPSKEYYKNIETKSLITENVINAIERYQIEITPEVKNECKENIEYNKQKCFEIYENVKNLLLKTENRSEIEILRDKLNADFNCNTAKFEEFVNQYNGYFKIAQIEHSGISEKEFIIITYLPNIERQYRASGELYPMHTNLGRMKEYLNNRLIELEKEPIMEPKKEKTTIVKTKKIDGLETKIQWNNDIKELAYLFYKLKEEKIIKIDNLGATLSKIFTDSDKNAILNTAFNKCISGFNSHNYPSKASDIDKLIRSIKKDL